MTSANQSASRILLAEDPFVALDRGRVLWQRGWWPARWLNLPAGGSQWVPGAAAFRLPLNLEQAGDITLHLTAGERYRLYIDGQVVGHGPERGDERSWRVDSWQLHLSAGSHWLAVEVWALGLHSPTWQASVMPGLLVVADESWHERITTGQAAWQVRAIDAYSLEEQPRGFLTGPRVIVDGARMPWDWTTGGGDGFVDATPSITAHCDRSVTGREHPTLVPATTAPVSLDLLPNGQVVLIDDVPDPDAQTPLTDPAKHQADQVDAWQGWLDGRSALTLAPGTTRRCIVDLGVYRAFWPSLQASGSGGRVRLRFAEGLYRDPNSWDKGDRRQWQGRYFAAVGPAFRTAAGPQRTYRPLDWECGRWMEIVAHAGDQPLVLGKLELRDTSYPLRNEGQVESDDARLPALRDLCLHTLRVGTHSHYCDCPYYERLQYVGDTRLEALTTYVLTHDNALQRRALFDFANARFGDGLVPSRHPAKGTQIIAPFALYWVQMLHDWAWWRDDPAVVRQLLPTARGILDAWWSYRNGDGLLEKPAGWNFVDWVPGWDCGMAPGADQGVSSILNWHAAWTARMTAELEDHFGEPELAALQRRRATQLAQALDAAWDARRGRYVDQPGNSSSASEHVQSMALLSGLMPASRLEAVGHSLAHDSDLVRTTIYFTYYLFEAYRLLRRGDLLWQRLQMWFDLPEHGLTTTPEMPEPTRSDCHPWGAHALFHLAASIAGIRPAAPGFAAVRVEPLPGPLKYLNVSVPHPKGQITVDWRADQPLRVQAPVPVHSALEHEPALSAARSQA